MVSHLEKRREQNYEKGNEILFGNGRIEIVG